MELSLITTGIFLCEFFFKNYLYYYFTIVFLPLKNVTRFNLEKKKYLNLLEMILKGFVKSLECVLVLYRYFSSHECVLPS